MDAVSACALLATAGMAVDPDLVTVHAREDRWVAWLPDGRMAWFPMNAEGTRASPPSAVSWISWPGDAPFAFREC